MPSSAFKLDEVAQQILSGVAIPSVLRQMAFQASVEEVQVKEINLAVSVTDQVVDVTDITNLSALIILCDQGITFKVDDSTSVVTYTNFRSQILTWHTATALPALIFTVSTPATFPNDAAGNTVTTANLYILSAGNRT